MIPTEEKKIGERADHVCLERLAQMCVLVLAVVMCHLEMKCNNRFVRQNKTVNVCVHQSEILSHKDGKIKILKQYIFF